MLKSLDTPIQYLKGVGPQKAKILEGLGIITVEALFYYFPRRYEDRTNFVAIKDLKIGEVQMVKGAVLAKGEHVSWKRRSFKILEVAIGDVSARVFCVWFNQPYLKNYFKIGATVIVWGKVELYDNRMQINSPEFEVISDEEKDALDINRIVPVYSLSDGLTQRYLRKLVKKSLDEFLPYTKEILPYDIRKRHNLLNIAQSLINIHFPQNFQMQKEAYQRLSFEDFFIFQIPLLLRKLKRKLKIGIAHRIRGELQKEVLNNLGFELTAAQNRVLQEIQSDLSLPRPMQRLLQGDVACGKTVVAVLSACLVLEGGYQVAFMVPTEILAQQHFEFIKNQILKIKNIREQVKIDLLTSSVGKDAKEKLYRQIKEGKINLVIGTHTLIEENLEFNNLGLVIIDEQHKFGVWQRAILPKKGANPDCLIMTATPIPRTLSMTLYGDLDISTIDELPRGRIPIKTLSFPEEKIDEVYNFVREQIRSGRQAYIIYPVIWGDGFGEGESGNLDLKAAQNMYEELRKNIFKEFRVALVHGRIKESHRSTKIMQDFKQGRVDLLVATTVLEVGIDVPNANTMVIENAHRFGLSQLHQLRGRVGRGGCESYCILVSNPKTQDAISRIKAISQIHDGFRIAEEDLKIRGPGEFFGKRQHGLSELKIGNPLTQMQLLKGAREEARRLLNIDPALSSHQNKGIKEVLRSRFPEYEKLMVVG